MNEQERDAAERWLSYETAFTPDPTDMARFHKFVAAVWASRGELVDCDPVYREEINEILHADRGRAIDQKVLSNKLHHATHILDFLKDMKKSNMLHLLQ